MSITQTHIAIASDWAIAKNDWTLGGSTRIRPVALAAASAPGDLL